MLESPTSARSRRLPGSGRAEAAAILAGPALDPRGLTAIGASLVEAQDALDDGASGGVDPYHVQSIVVLTDGIENVPPMIASVVPGITASTYAVGVGAARRHQHRVAERAGAGHRQISARHRRADRRPAFPPSKFFLQILAGINNAQIVVDPTGNLVFGPTHRIPFDVARADFGLDAILTSPLAPAIDFRLEAPDGTIIDPALPAGGGAFVGRRQVSVLSSAAAARRPRQAGACGPLAGVAHARRAPG